MERGNVENLLAKKEGIIGFLKSRGPSLPVHISQNLGMDSLLASAMLADLLREKRIKISSLKVGNSPLYYMEGQENQLEKFYHYLPAKEREAFDKLKTSRILIDVSQEPAIRVALRSIKDFAFAFQHQGQIYWRFLGVNEVEAEEVISKINIKQPVSKAEPKLEVKQPVKQETSVEEEGVEEEIEKPKREKVFDNPFIEKKTKKKVKKKSEFEEAVEALLGEMEVKQDFGFKRKEYGAVVDVEGEDYLMIGKDKKSISYTDVTGALEKGKKLNLPIYMVSNGTPNKKASDWIEYFGDLFIFEKLE